MKKVHDIINIRVAPGLLDNRPEKSNFFPVAFIQYGNVEEGFHYEGVCPWCSASIGLVDPKGDMKERNKALCLMMAEHYRKGCSRFGSSRFDVERATGPLGTDKLPTVN